MPKAPDKFVKNKKAKKNHGNQGRRTAADRGYDRQWQTARVRFLRSNPLCADCASRDRIVMATRVDHDQAHRGDMALFWDQSNWRPMCEICHNRKAAAENTGNMMVSHRPKWIEHSVIPVTLVAGCHAAGKTKFINERAGSRDLVIDLPQIVADVSGFPIYTAHQSFLGIAVAKRNNLLSQLSSVSTARRYDHCYFSQAIPEAKVRNWWASTLGSKSVVIMASEETCVERVLESGYYPTSYVDYVRDWHRRYTVDFKEEVVFSDQ